MGKVKGGYSSLRIRKGFSGKRRSSTLGPKVLGLLFGRGKLTKWAGMGDTSIGGGTRGVGYGLSKSMFDNGAYDGMRRSSVENGKIVTYHARRVPIRFCEWVVHHLARVHEINSGTAVELIVRHRGGMSWMSRLLL